MTDSGWNDQERAMRRAFAWATAEMLRGDDDGPRAEVAIGRRLVIEATRTFDEYVARARAAGFTWEQIAERVPGYTRDNGAEAAEVLFIHVAGSPRSGFVEHYGSWRRSHCEGIVLDCGLYDGHPADAERGHRQGCRCPCRDIAVYVTGLEPDNEVDAAVDHDVEDEIHGGPPPVPRIHVRGPGSALPMSGLHDPGSERPNSRHTSEVPGCGQAQARRRRSSCPRTHRMGSGGPRPGGR